MHSRKRLVLGINVLVLLVITVVFFVTKKAPDDIELSKSAGFYKDEVSIEIKSKGNYEIHYTLDSSAPTISSPKYEETLNFRNASSNENIYSIRTDTAPGYIAQEVEELGERVRTVYHTPTYLVPKCNVLRVASFDTTGELVDEKTVSVFVDNKNDVAFDNVLVASVTTDPENLFNYEEGIYIMGERWDKGIYSPNRPEGYDLWNANYRYTSSYGQKEAHLELFDKNGNSYLTEDGILRLKGNRSRSNAQKSLCFIFDEEKEVYPLGKKNLERIEFFAGGQDEIVKIEDYFTHMMLKDQGYKVSTYEMYPVQLFLEGEYWGMYFLQDVYTKEWVGETYGVSPESVVIIKNNEIQEGLDDEAKKYNEFIDYVADADAGKAVYKTIADTIDIESFIDFYAIEIYIGQTDFGGGKNTEMWKSRMNDGEYGDGLYRYMLFDVNGEGSFHNTTSKVFELLNEDDDLYIKLMADEKFQNRLAGKLRQLAETTFSPERSNEFLQSFMDENREYLKASNRRFLDDEAEGSLDSKLAEMKAFMSDRPEQINNMFVQFYGKSIWDYEYNGEEICQ